jgi:hypothetical protein
MAILVGLWWALEPFAMLTSSSILRKSEMLVNNIKNMKKFHKFVSFTKPYPFLWTTKRVRIEKYFKCGIPNDHKISNVNL